MSKTSKTKAPDTYGSFSISGGPTATHKNGATSYTLSNAQQRAYDYAQNAFADGLSNINSFLPETVNSIYSQVNAYKNQAMEELDDLYTPMLRETQNDAARRFGNLDNKVFLDNYGSVEKQRGKAMATLADNITAKTSDLYQQELQNRYNYLDFLNNYQNQVFQNAASAVGLANSAASLKAQNDARYANTGNSWLSSLSNLNIGSLLGNSSTSKQIGNVYNVASSLVPLFA